MEEPVDVFKTNVFILREIENMKEHERKKARRSTM